MEQELISVIIPVYNVEKYLRECVDSVLVQTYSHLEIILVDDGSTDQSGVICDEYVKKDSRVKVIHQKNKGLSGARNTGLTAAAGTYVYFLDSDDWLIPTALELLLDRAKEETADVVFFQALSFEDGKPECTTTKGYSYQASYETNVGLKVIEQLQKNKEYHSAVPLLFLKKSFIEENKLKFEEGIVYEDMLFTFELFCKAVRVAQLKEHLYMRRYRSDSIMTSRKTKKNFMSAYIVYDKVRALSDKLKIAEETFAKEYIVRCAFNTFNYYAALNKTERTECLDEFKKFRQDVLERNAYGNKALEMRCYGYIPWVIYKVVEKVFLTGMKGKN